MPGSRFYLVTVSPEISVSVRKDVSPGPSPCITYFVTSSEMVGSMALLIDSPIFMDIPPVESTLSELQLNAKNSNNVMMADGIIFFNFVYLQWRYNRQGHFLCQGKE